MKKIFAVLFILCSTVTMAQKQTADNSPQKIEGIVKVQMPTEWYIQQSKLWEQRVMARQGPAPTSGEASSKDSSP